MKIRTPDILFAITACSVFLAVFFIRHSGEFGQPYFQAEITAEQTGVVQVFLNYGSGYSEHLSKRGSVDTAQQPKVIRLGLGHFPVDSIRFDPLNAGGAIRIRKLGITTGNGTLIQELTASNVTQSVNVQDWQVEADGSIRFTVDPQSDDPQIHLVGIAKEVFRPQVGRYFDQAFGWGFLVFGLALLLKMLARTPALASGVGLLSKQLYLVNRKTG